MKKEEILQSLKQAILNFDEEGVTKAAKKVIVDKINPLEAIDTATEAIREIGERFHRMEVFLPQLVISAKLMERVTEILEPAFPIEKKPVEKAKIVIGTVKGDIHDIGKNIVSILLKIAGFKVYDLGKDVKIETFVEKAEEVGADIIALSALMTTTIPLQKELIEELKRLGIREKYKVMVGGGAVTRKWMEQIGADGWGEGPLDTVVNAKKLVGLE